MPGWLEVIVGGGAAIMAGLVLLYGFDRGWFSDHYTSTVEGGEGAMVLGVFLLAGGAIALIAGFVIAN